MLALVTYKFIYHLLWGRLYYIVQGAGFCSIITKRVFADT